MGSPFCLVKTARGAVYSENTRKILLNFLLLSPPSRLREAFLARHPARL